MLNDLRGWLRAPAPSTAVPGDVRFVEPARLTGFVLDQEQSSSQLLSTLLEESGLQPEVFSETKALVAALDQRTPEMVFVEVAQDGNEAIDTLFALGGYAFKGPVQLMGDRAVQVMETVRRMGERHSLQMLPSLHKPLETASVRAILRAQGFEPAPEAVLAGGLGEALQNGWVQFWYQPKIDLKKKQIAGVETFARIQHPRLGTLQPGAFMPSASTECLTELTRRALVSALTVAANMSQLGINLRLAVNTPLNALVSLPILEMVKQHGPKKPSWPGLILDVTEEQIATEVPLVKSIAERLALANVRLAVDDFGRGQLPLAAVRELSFAEFKLDRSFVRDCSTERANGTICKTVIDLAHNFGSLAVAIGVEKAADVHALQAMGCDLGQGYLFGQPMPEDRLVALLRQRAAMPKRAGAAPAVAGRA
jgi:EAL domain-containing protein (putative c-di-GMP-specific phosphodiesterase class I)